MGLEPTTLCLQSRCSIQLSYVPGARSIVPAAGLSHPPDTVIGVLALLFLVVTAAGLVASLLGVHGPASASAARRDHVPPVARLQRVGRPQILVLHVVVIGRADALGPRPHPQPDRRRGRRPSPRSSPRLS